MANPTLLSRLLCADADKNTIPDTDAGTAGVFSQQYGWQAINSLPLSAGGKAVQRQDFNGVFNLLGGIAFYTQKGYTFEWDIDQDYYANCVVTDPLDGNRYNAKNDVAKGGSNPSLDPTNWERFADTSAMLTREVTPAFNTRDVITTSGTYTAPVTGWYRITAKGGGGGGAGGTTRSATACIVSGGSGGEGGTTITYFQMTAGDTATVVIGGGGSGGSANGGLGTNGGDTTVTIDGNTYTAGGGKSPTNYLFAGLGGTGTIQGCAGHCASSYYVGSYSNTWEFVTGGGVGGGVGGNAGVTGGGGYGGYGSDSSPQAGGAGGDGYVWFEYFANI